jgi:hypothetical protein
MKTAKIATIKFKFTFSDNSTMETTYIGSSMFSHEGAISHAWRRMADSDFDRNLIVKTLKIEILKIDLT